jgi:hypothetical protein
VPARRSRSSLAINPANPHKKSRENRDLRFRAGSAPSIRLHGLDSDLHNVYIYARYHPTNNGAPLGTHGGKRGCSVHETVSRLSSLSTHVPGLDAGCRAGTGVSTKPNAVMGARPCRRPTPHPCRSPGLRAQHPNRKRPIFAGQLSCVTSQRRAHFSCRWCARQRTAPARILEESTSNPSSRPRSLSYTGLDSTPATTNLIRCAAPLPHSRNGPASASAILASKQRLLEVPEIPEQPPPVATAA